MIQVSVSDLRRLPIDWIQPNGLDLNKELPRIQGRHARSTKRLVWRPWLMQEKLCLQIRKSGLLDRCHVCYCGVLSADQLRTEGG